jgi:hypothetical protein
MDFSFTEEQSMLRDSVASYLADHYDFDMRRAAVKSAAGWRPEVWRAFAQDLGILGAAFPEDMGGLGGGATEVMVVMEEFGKALVVEPYLASVVIAGGFLKHAPAAAAAELIGKIIAGEATFAFAWAEPQGRYALSDLKTTARKDGGDRRSLGEPPHRHRPHQRRSTRHGRRFGLRPWQGCCRRRLARVSHRRRTAGRRGFVRKRPHPRLGADWIGGRRPADHRTSRRRGDRGDLRRGLRSASQAA